MEDFTLNKKWLKAALVIVGSLVYLWCVAAVYYLPFLPQWIWLRVSLCALIAVGAPASVIYFKFNKRSFIGCFSVFLLVMIVFQFKRPSNDRDWQTSVSWVPLVEIEGDSVFIRNIRNFKYRSTEDFDVAYYDKAYSVGKLDSLYLILSYWDGNTSIAHAIFSFGFEGGEYLAISSEVRLEKNKEFSLMGGLFNTDFHGLFNRHITFTHL